MERALRSAAGRRGISGGAQRLGHPGCAGRTPRRPRSSVPRPGRLRRPVSISRRAVQGMGLSRVVLFKSPSKTLSPALGIGWMVAPPRAGPNCCTGPTRWPPSPRPSTNSPSPPCRSRAPTTVIRGPAAVGTGSAATRSSGPSPKSCPVPRSRASRPASLSSCGCAPARPGPHRAVGCSRIPLIRHT